MFLFRRFYTFQVYKKALSSTDEVFSKGNENESSSPHKNKTEKPFSLQDDSKTDKTGMN